MKYSLLLSLLFSALLFSQNQIIDDFEDGTPGHFNLHTAYSGSTKGIISTTPAVDTTTAAFGRKSLKIVLIDDPGAGDNWFVRFLSATGNPAGNVTLNDTGYVGFWLKSNRSYVMASMILDDLNASGSGIGTNEISDTIAIAAVNTWQLFQWNVADSNKWYPFIASGNGMIQDPVSIDAIVFHADNNFATGDTAIVHLDQVSFRVDGMLPVELASFDAVVEGNAVDLRWITASELNNRGFEIERAAGGNAFSVIGFVNGNGTVATPTGYTFSDKLYAPGIYYYRLKQIDMDGAATYSKVIEVKVLSVPWEFSLGQNYPNPFNPSTQVVFNLPQAGMTNLSVYNMLGEKVLEALNGYLESGEHTLTIRADGLPSGTYIYRLTSGGEARSMKMTVLK